MLAETLEFNLCIEPAILRPGGAFYQDPVPRLPAPACGEILAQLCFVFSGMASVIWRTKMAASQGIPLTAE